MIMPKLLVSAPGRIELSFTVMGKSIRREGWGTEKASIRSSVLDMRNWRWFLIIQVEVSSRQLEMTYIERDDTRSDDHGRYAVRKEKEYKE